jgi:hypothetical protein
MGEQIKRYRVSYREGIAEDTGQWFHADASQPMVLASDFDREIAQRDARIVELEKQVAAATEFHIAMVNAAANVEAERDTAREMLRSAQKWMQHGTACNINQYGQRLADKSLVCSCGLDQFLASMKE